jgi:hypothetical protein
MTRSLVIATLTVALLLAGVAGAAARRVVLGMGEQQTGMFAEPRYERLGLRHARVLADWDALTYKRQRKALDLWMAQAEEAGTRVLLSFRYSRHRRFPRPAEFERAFRGFRERYPDVDTWGVWNEANHGGGYTARHPGAVARLYDAAVRECPSCRIVGADVLDSQNMLPWVRAFKRAARHPVRIWGLHNYIDARRGSDRRTRALLAETRGQVWFTETGSWLLRRRYDEKGRVLQVWKRTRRQSVHATRHVFRLACLSPRIRRVYLYNWRAPWIVTTWDSGFVNRHGRPRPAYHVLRRQVDRAGGPYIRCR